MFSAIHNTQLFSQIWNRSASSNSMNCTVCNVNVWTTIFILSGHKHNSLSAWLTSSPKIMPHCRSPSGPSGATHQCHLCSSAHQQSLLGSRQRSEWLLMQLLSGLQQQQVLQLSATQYLILKCSQWVMKVPVTTTMRWSHTVYEDKLTAALKRISELEFEKTFAVHY